MRDVDAGFTTSIVVKPNGALRDFFDLDCPELADKVIVFGSLLSTSDDLMPRSFDKSDRHSGRSTPALLITYLQSGI